MSSSATGQKSMKERLMELQMKKNAARGMLKKATEDEVALEKAGPKALAKKEKEEEEKKLEQFKAKLQEEGIDPEKYHLLHQTQEAQELQDKKNKRKQNPGEGDEVDVFGMDGQYRAFKRQRAHTEFDKEAYERQKEDMGEHFFNPQTSLEYGNVANDDPNRVNEMVDAVKAQQERNAKFSRRRAFDENDDVTFINERNRKFVQKINRAFDQYTEEIRENIERGTAI